MKAPNQLPVPFPADLQQIQIMRQVIDSGNHTIASEGTDRFDLCTKMVEGGYMARCHCQKACDVHQFSVTNKGIDAIQRVGHDE